MYMQWHFQVGQTLFHSRGPLFPALPVFLMLFFMLNPEFCREEWDVDVSFWAECLIHSLLFSIHWPVMGISYDLLKRQNRKTQRLLWWGLKDALISEYKDKNLRGSLFPYPLSKIIAFSSSYYLGSHRFWRQLTVPGVTFIFNSIYKWLVIPIMFMPLLLR